MQWTFKLRGNPVTLTSVEGTVAVRPDEAARAGRATRRGLTQRFGGVAIDTSQGGRFGLDLPSRNRKLFEQAGWLFVEPRPEVALAAAMTDTRVEDAEAVQQVFVDPSGAPQVTTDVLTIQVDPDLPEAEVARRVGQDGLRLGRRLAFAPNAYEVRAADQRPLPELVAALQEDPYYQFAEPMLLQALTGRFRPTDPNFVQQWQHTNDGGNGGRAGADLHIEQAWNLTRGRGAQRPVRIAVIDNGMQVRHPDLRPGVKGGGSFTSDGFGSATFARLRADLAGFPDNGHGTFCLGMAGARMNNNRGGCGSAPEADLLAIACANDQVGTQATLARAVAYAADPSREVANASPADGADVIASSLGPNGPDWDLTSVLDLAVRYAAGQGRGGRGTPIFWAVSNGHFPVARDEICSHPNVIGVGRSNRLDLADGSAFGPELDFLAPGAEVYSTKSGGRYGFSTGTSFAAPLAAGVGALVLALHPDWTADQVLKRLRETCDKVGSVNYNAAGRHDEYGFGRLNAARAVQ